MKVILVGLFEKDEIVDICMKNKIDIELDIDLCDIENVLLKENIYDYFVCEVLLYVLDVWIDEIKIKIGYEILFIC